METKGCSGTGKWFGAKFRENFWVYCEVVGGGCEGLSITG